METAERVFVVHQGNRLESLASRLADLLREPAGAPLSPDIVVVQSLGMGRWLSLWLAAELGVCANVRFPFPASFVWDVFRAVLGPLPIVPTADPSIARWHLMSLLQELDAAPAFDPLRAYLTGTDERGRFELAGKIANTFDQYLVYRPDWIQAWERGEEDDWQARLWRQLATRLGGKHRVQLWDDFRRRLPSITDWSVLPPRVALFGIPSLAPMYVDVFAQVAAHIDVHCFVLNPCQESWSHILRERDLARVAGQQDPHALYLETGNRLLASWGRQGRELLDQLTNYDPHDDSDFQPPEGETLLAKLQTDILTLHDRPRERTPQTAAADDSLQVHSCHSPLREIEVLHDQLLLLFDRHDVSPADVVVMTPDIDAYAPAIDAVFGAIARDRATYIPYTIADRRQQQESPLIDAVLALLALSRSRYEAARVLALLAVPAVRRRFDLGEADLTRAREWIRDTGVRWGLDTSTRADAAIPITNEHTWRFGLDRLLLGYALADAPNRACGGVAPHDDIDADEADLLGRLHTFVDALAAARADLHHPRPAQAWAETLRALLDRFCLADDTDERDLQTVRAAIARLETTAATANFTEPVSRELVIDHLRESLDVPGGGSRFLAGGVTFCALMPMRSIPFQVVCLVGMNDGSMPRSSRAISFDRMATDRRRGDRSRRDDDRYLFLEALNSARTCFYLSYVGRDIHDDTQRAPSILVTELLDYVGHALGADVVTTHPLQAFSARYFDGRDARLVSHSQELCQASGVAGGGRTDVLPFVAQPLPAAGVEWHTVTLARLQQFFAHPSRFFLRERLGVRLDERDAQVESREPFLLDGLERWDVRQKLLALQQDGVEMGAAEGALRGRGVLPHGTVGEVVLQTEWGDVQDFGQRLAALRHEPLRDPLKVDLTLGGVRLVGTLDGVTRAGRVAYRLGKTRPADRTGLWLAHLVLQLVAPADVERTSRWLASDDDSVLELPPYPDAAQALASLMTLYRRGLDQPLLLLPRTAWAFLTAKRPWPAARDEWEGNDFVSGESEDPYFALAFRGVDPLGDEFEQISKEVFRCWVAGETA